MPGQNGKTFQAPRIPGSVTSHNLFRANETISFVITRAYLEKQRGQLQGYWLIYWNDFYDNRAEQVVRTKGPRHPLIVVNTKLSRYLEPFFQ